MSAINAAITIKGIPELQESIGALRDKQEAKLDFQSAGHVKVPKVLVPERSL